ncbi:MAG: UDP-glucose/GDP-mannose dehydrogenase family protein [Candidatus Hydrogenedentota bacterium]|nr:MAG: UDP-glucose/GDP-mannose dehydrogenase family protein [Candidatus Hydrogenedentota bacterium]
MAPKNVTVIGTGYVGLVTGTCLAECGHNVLCVDNDESKVRLLRGGGNPIYEPGLDDLLKRNTEAGRLAFSGEIREGVEHGEIIFIAVHTPPRRDGSADLSFVEAVSREVATVLSSLEGEPYRLVVEKSTVPVRTGEQVLRTIRLHAREGVTCDVASNPEFLREGTAVEDFLHPDRIVIGVQSERAERLLRELYAPIEAPVIVTDIPSAEIIKHASNAFLAMKISFINSVANVAERTGADISCIARGVGMDKRIGASFLNAGIGYGGSCFPKDVQAFERIAKEEGVDFGLLREVERVNANQRRLFVQKVKEALWVVKGKTLGVWGLSFKPNTDDMRSAPSIDILRWLDEEGAILKAYDPAAVEKARPLLPEGVSYADSAEEAARGADALLVLTEWDEFRRFTLQDLKRLLAQPVVVDGRNLFDPREMRKERFVYYSIGRPPVIPD